MNYLYFVITDEDKILGFKSKARARGFTRATDYALYFTPWDLSRIPTDYIVQEHNKRHPLARIDNFPTRAAAMDWFAGVLQDIAIPGEASGPVKGPVDNNHPSVRSRVMATKKKATKKAAKKSAGKKAASASKGRPSQYSGKKLYKISKDNPRRAGTSGFNSFRLITNGMTYEDYIAKGGVRRDLEWDLEHKWVRLS